MNTGFSDDDDDAVMSEINMTPLVDVMLVLLIIFLVTIPAMQHAVKIDLPHASSQPVDENRRRSTSRSRVTARSNGTTTRSRAHNCRNASRKRQSARRSRSCTFARIARSRTNTSRK